MKQIITVSQTQGNLHKNEFRWDCFVDH